MTTWWWVRHGPTHAKAMIGWTDLAADLSDTAALKRLSDYLPHAPIVSSTLSRAIATADAVQASRPRLPHTTALREIHFGAWEARSFAEIEAETPAHIRTFWEQPGDIAPPGGESWNALTARVSAFVDAHPPHANIIAVAHFGVILTQLQRALSLTAYDTLSHKIDNLSVTKLTHSHGRWTCDSLNHIP